MNWNWEVTPPRSMDVDSEIIIAYYIDIIRVYVFSFTVPGYFIRVISERFPK